MHYVYLIRSRSRPDQTYIGRTDDLKTRFRGHNKGESPHTRKYRPWKLVCYVAFEDQQKAIDLEKYLKIGSGHAFARRHFW